MMAEALGGIIGSFLCSKIKGQETIQKMILYLVSTGVWLTLIPIISKTINPNVCLILYFCFAGTLAIYNIQFSSYVQIHVDAHYIGRVFSVVHTIAVLFMPVGSFVFSKLLPGNIVNNYYIVGGGIVFVALIGLTINKIKCLSPQHKLPQD